MDLTPIIYSSILVVFSLLGLVLSISFVCSKMSYCRSNTNRRVKKAERNFVSEAVMTSVDKDLSKHIDEEEPIVFVKTIVEKEPISFSIPDVEEEQIEKNMVNYMSNSEMLHQEMMYSDYLTSVSRYSVVNSLGRNESYSKMSVQYS